MSMGGDLLDYGRRNHGQVISDLYWCQVDHCVLLLHNKLPDMAAYLFVLITQASGTRAGELDTSMRHNWQNFSLFWNNLVVYAFHVPEKHCLMNTLYFLGSLRQLWQSFRHSRKK